jgi:hypothetical protein
VEQAFYVFPVHAKYHKAGIQIRQSLVGSQEGETPADGPFPSPVTAVDQADGFKEFRQVTGDLREKTSPPACSDYSNPGFFHKHLAGTALSEKA